MQMTPTTKAKTITTTMAWPRWLFALLAYTSTIVRRNLLVGSFSPPSDVPRVGGRRDSFLSMAPSGTGMGTKKGGGMSSSSSSSSNNNNNNNGKGMGRKKGSSSTKADGKQPYDVAKAWIKSQKLYDEIMYESTRAFNAAPPSGEGLENDDEPSGVTTDVTTEYIVAARCRAAGASNGDGNGNGNNSAMRSASDWIPVAQVCVARPIIRPVDDGSIVGRGRTGDDSDDDAVRWLPVRAAVSYYCREIFFAATLASPALKSLPRNLVEYSAEPVDSWIRHVYEDVIEGKSADSYVDSSSGTKVGMTKSRAREILGLEVGCVDAYAIKSAYKRESMACHPDRFVNVGGEVRTREEIDRQSERFALVKMAYEALNSGVRGGGMIATSTSTTTTATATTVVGSSWYESLGGRSRTDFLGPIDLMPMDVASALCNDAYRSAVVGLDPDLTNAFVLRNQAAATAAGRSSS